MEIQKDSIAYYTNKYCTKYPCSICPCGRYEFPDCVRELAKLEESQQESVGISGKFADEISLVIEVE